MVMDKSFAVLIVCYKRLDGIKRLLRSLECVDFDDRDDITLIFSIDRSDDDAVERFASEYEWGHGEKRVLARDERLGLKRHILLCGDLTEEYDILVVLEDDVYVSDSMYHYAYSAALHYWDDDRVAGISLFAFQKNWLAWHLRFEPQRTVYDAYFLKVAQSWGQVWTAPKWRPFKEWLSENAEFPHDDVVPDDLYTWGESSWLKHHDRYCIARGKYFVYPYLSLSTNFSDAGEHSRGATNDHQVELQCGKRDYSFPTLGEDAIAYDEYMDREGLGRYLGVPEGQLTVDFWGTKREGQYRRYVLTSRPLNRPVVKGFSLSLRPIELSVISGLEGDGLWLYDMVGEPCDPPAGYDPDALVAYGLRTSDFKVLVPLGVRGFFKRLCRKVRMGRR